MTTPERQRRTAPRDSDNDTSLLRQRNHELSTLKAIAERLNTGVGLQETLCALPLVLELLGLHTGWVFLRDQEGRFSLAAHDNLPPALEFPGPAWRADCTCQQIACAGRLHGGAQVIECSRLRSAAGDRQELAYHASVPLEEGGRLLGIMNVATSQWNLFTPQSLEILSAVGFQLATAIARTQLAEQATAMARIEERNRLAREVHDTLAQELAAITLQLEAADALLDSAPDRARVRLRQALDRARESLEEARRSVLDLRAGPLERQPLAAAIEAFGQRLADETGIAVSTAIDLAGQRISARSEMALYRIAQEALTNVRRHANASAVSIELRVDEQHAQLTISDNGQGFSDGGSPAEGGHGFGLTGMQERARLLNGTLQVSSNPGAGVRIEARIPLDMPRRTTA